MAGGDVAGGDVAGDDPVHGGAVRQDAVHDPDAADGWLDEVHRLVAEIPPARVMTYGLIAEVLADRAVAAGRRPRGGPRQVGRAMAQGGDVPWWRVVRADGRLPVCHEGSAREHLRAEGTPLTPDGERVRVRQAVWFPEQ